MKEDHLLDDLAPQKKRVIKKRKHVSMKGLPVNVAMRRQATAELGEDPTKIARDAVFMKFGLIDTVIDRNVKIPNWKSEVLWKNELKQFHNMTAGLVTRQRYQSRQGYTTRTFTTGNPPQAARLWSHPEGKNRPYPNPSMPLSRPAEYKNSPRG